MRGASRGVLRWSGSEEDGAGDAASGSFGGRSAVTPVAWVVAPAVVARTHGSGRPRAHRPTLLRGSADRSAGRGPDERRRKLPGSGRGESSPVRSRKNGAEAKNRHRWSAERRAGRRHRPVISGDQEIGPTAKRTTGAAFRTSACRRSAPPRSREGHGKEGGPGAFSKNTGSAALA